MSKCHTSCSIITSEATEQISKLQRQKYREYLYSIRCTAKAQQWSDYVSIYRRGWIVFLVLRALILKSRSTNSLVFVHLFQVDSMYVGRGLTWRHSLFAQSKAAEASYWSMVKQGAGCSRAAVCLRLFVRSQFNVIMWWTIKFFESWISA